MESLHLAAPHPKSLHMHKTHAAVQTAECVPSPPVHLHDLHKPAQIDANANINYTVRGLLAITQSNSFSY